MDKTEYLETEQKFMLAKSNLEDEIYSLTRNINWRREENEEDLRQLIEIYSSITTLLKNCQVEVGICNAILELQANVKKLAISMRKA